MSRKLPLAQSAGGSVHIANARILDAAGNRDYTGHVGIRGGVVDYAGKVAPRERYAQTVDAKGLWLMPGLVDMSARLREPGHTSKASFASETAAAQASGVTTLLLPPDTRPVLDTPAMVARVLRLAEATGGLDVQVLGALTAGLNGETLSEMSALKAAGCIALSNAYTPLAHALLARRALDYARGLGLTVHVFAQDAALANGGCAHEGPVATRLGLPGIPAAAEVAALRLWISLVEDTGARVHFARLSTARGAELVETAQSRGLPVSADVAAHQLHLTETDVDGFRAMAHVQPPLRSREDRDGLREAVRKGVIAAICSDHQPHEADAKINPYPLTEPGISALETLLPLTLALVHEKILSPLQAAQRLSSGPAAVAGLAAPALKAGTPASLILVDAAARWTLKPDALRSAGRNTPFAGQVLRGRVLRTWHRGHEVFRL